MAHQSINLITSFAKHADAELDGILHLAEIAFQNDWRRRFHQERSAILTGSEPAGASVAATALMKGSMEIGSGTFIKVAHAPQKGSLVRRVTTFVVLSLFAVGPAMAQGGTGAAAGPRSGASRLSPDVGAGQSPSQAAHDHDSRYTRQSIYAKPSKNPNQPGNAASDGTAGTSSPRSPEPKPD